MGDMNQGQNQERPDAEARAIAHFDNYVGPVIRLEQKHAFELRKGAYYGNTPFEATVEGMLLIQLQAQAFESIRHHYITSHVHGTKHGIEDALAAAKSVARMHQYRSIVQEEQTGGPDHDLTVTRGIVRPVSQPKEEELPVTVRQCGMPPVGYDSMGEISDGYHTFDELYEHRHALFLALMRSSPVGRAWYTGIHGDGTPSYPGWVLCCVELPEGPVSYHLPERLLPEIIQTRAERLDKGKPWDGHTAADVVTRLKAFATR